MHKFVHKYCNLNEIYFREFTLLSSGKRHYKNTHEAISHECILCHKTLKNDSAYVLHLKKNHDVTKKQIEEAKVIKMQEQDYLLVISEKNVVGFLKLISYCLVIFLHFYLIIYFIFIAMHHKCWLQRQVYCNFECKTSLYDFWTKSSRQKIQSG